MRSLLHHLAGQRGTTLAELLVAMPIALLLGATVMGMAGVFGDNERATANRTASIQAGQVALERITREIRQAKSVSPATGATPRITLSTFVASGGTRVPATVQYDCSTSTCLRSSPPASSGGTPVLAVASPDVFTVNATGTYVRVVAQLPVAGASQPIVVTDGAGLANAPAS